MVTPLFSAQDDEWVVMVGRYILNMGALEMATRLVIGRIDGTDQTPIFSSDLAARLGYIRKRYPRTDNVMHERAMKIFEVAERHTGFRNIIAHSPIVISGEADGTLTIIGIMNVTPKSSTKLGEIVSLEELKGRVDESAAVARDVLAMAMLFEKNAGKKVD
jgi:hypothetical protein